jgi:hypothetical protein
LRRLGRAQCLCEARSGDAANTSRVVVSEQDIRCALVACVPNRPKRVVKGGVDYRVLEYHSAIEGKRCEQSYLIGRLVNSLGVSSPGTTEVSFVVQVRGARSKDDGVLFQHV